MTLLLLLLGLTPAAGETPHLITDTLRLEVGSPEVDGRVFPFHRARNRVYMGDATEPNVTWTNELTLGDSAGIRVMRWVTRGEVRTPNGGTGTWELLQTYDAATLAPLAYSSKSSAGGFMNLQMDGLGVRGVRKAPGDTLVREVDQVLERRGFMASASDLIPMAVGLRAGAVMIAPVWGPNMDATEDRIFTVFEEERVQVEGAEVTAWKVEERVAATGALSATWWLTEASPYMVLAEIPLPNGGVQRITGVSLEP